MWIIFECDRIQPGQSPQNERRIENAVFETSEAAWEAAQEMRIASRGRHSYVLGMID